MNINELNDDCLMLIFTLMPFKQLMSARRVCKHWRDSIDSFIQKERHFVYCQHINTCKSDSNAQKEAFDDYFFRYQDKIESLINLTRFEFCVRLMPNLTSLTLIGVKANDGMLPILAANCPKITKLHFMSGEESLTFVGLKYMVEKFPDMTHIDMPNFQLDDDLIYIIVSNLKHLIHFNFGTDRNQGVRLSRFTGHSLKNIGVNIKSLMIGESMYWDEAFVPSLIEGNARNVTTLKIHLIKLKDLRTICENMPQLKSFYCSFNGGDIYTRENNIGCVSHVKNLHNLEVLELIDDGRHHCGSKGCHSVYDNHSLIQIMNGCPNLRILKLIDYDNWHTNKHEIDTFLSRIKYSCPNLNTFGVSAGLFHLCAKSFGLIAAMNMKKLLIQGDTSIQDNPDDSKRVDHITNEVIIDLIRSNCNLVSLKLENCPHIGEEVLKECLKVAATRTHEWFDFTFINTRMQSSVSNNYKIPDNVSLKILKEEEEANIDLDVDTDSFSSLSTWNNSEEDTDHSFNSDNSIDSD